MGEAKRRGSLKERTKLAMEARRMELLRRQRAMHEARSKEFEARRLESAGRANQIAGMMDEFHTRRRESGLLAPRLMASLALAGALRAMDEQI